MHDRHEELRSALGNPMMGSPIAMFVFGVAVGATVALLYAPAPGSEIRSQITEKASNLKDKAGEWKDQVLETAGEWKEKAMSTAHNTLDRAKETVQDTLDHTADTMKNASDSVHFAQSRQGTKV